MGNRLAKTIQNGMIYALGNALLHGSHILLMPLWTMWLQPSDFGLVSNLRMFHTIGVTILCFGVPATIMRFQHERIANGGMDGRRLVSANLVFLCAAALSVGVLLTLMGSRFWGTITGGAIPYAPFGPLAYWQWVLAVPVACFLSLQRARERAVSVLVVQVLQLAVFVAVSLYLLQVIVGGATALAIGMFAGNAVLCFYCVPFLFCYCRPIVGDGRLVKQGLSYGMPLIVHTMSLFLLGYVSRLTLMHYEDEETIGIFAVAAIIGSGANVLIHSVTAAWWPVFCRIKDGGREDDSSTVDNVSYTVVVGAGVLCIAGSFLVPEIVKVALPSDYHPATAYLPPLLMASYAYVCYILVSLPIQYAKKTWAITTSSAVSVVVVLGLHIIFVPKYGAAAAAVLTWFGYGLNVFILSILGWRVTDQQIVSKRCVLGAIAMMIVGVLTTGFGLPDQGLAVKAGALVVICLFGGLVFLAGGAELASRKTLEGMG